MRDVVYQVVNPMVERMHDDREDNFQVHSKAKQMSDRVLELEQWVFYWKREEEIEREDARI